MAWNVLDDSVAVTPHPHHGSAGGTGAGVACLQTAVTAALGPWLVARRLAWLAVLSSLDGEG